MQVMLDKAVGHYARIVRRSAAARVIVAMITVVGSVAFDVGRSGDRPAAEAANGSG
ncbi:hypothetical protein ABT346_25490 [Micromonospora peucetia]|uniref:hypothetical protein n=1 Tax=Micromonospora peucetia TaxID=47871 RepID=UPI003318D79A